MNIQYSVSYTQTGGDAIGIARLAVVDGFKNFMIFGGDGTLHEVTNGLMHASSEERKSISYVVFPCGTGNDFARHFRIPSKPQSWIKFLESALTQPIDVCQINMPDKPVLYYANEAGIGLQYEVAQRLSENIKSGGRWQYVWQSLQSLFVYHGVLVQIKVNEYPPREDHLWNLTIANSRYLGGGFQLCPKADPNDGLLSFSKIRYVSKWRLILDIVRFFNGRIDTLSYTTVGKTSKILVEPLGSQEVLIEVDGEVRGSLPAEFSVINNALNIYVPS